MTTREEYVQQLKNKLDEWNAKLDELKLQAKLAEMENREKLDMEIETYQARRDEIRARLEEMRTSGEEAFDDLRQGAEQAFEALKESFYNARSHFKK